MRPRFTLASAQQLFFRKTSQKPNEELIREFRNDFPHVFSELSIASTLHPQGLVTHAQPGALQPAPWNEQSSMRSNLVNFVSPTDQPHGLYTPLPDQMCAVLHSPAGDLHTPTVGWNLTSSPSRWTQMLSGQTVRSQDDPLPANIAAFPSVDPSQVFSNADPFAPTFDEPPSVTRYFDHDHREYVAPDECDRKESFATSVRELSTDHSVSLASNVPERVSVHPEIPYLFRYHVILHAPTAMFDHARDIPVTYLNKAQTYTITVVDSRPPVAPAQLVQYRTRIGIAFEELTHRSNPALCWQLWHDARGGSDAERRGSSPCAVELVALKGCGLETPDPMWHLESASFNQFCVSWTSSGVAHSAECRILVRFHFLSTDFTQSKGVKGVPVRLCAKTERILSPECPPEGETEAEICYCRVKVFRDHGAERKLANDVAHIQKSIDRVEKQIARADYHGGAPGKKQKRRSVARGPTPNDPTRSMMSVFSLPGDEQDDPDQLASITLGNHPPSSPDGMDVRSDTYHDGPTEDGLPGRPSRSPVQRPFSITPGKASAADPAPVACFYVQIQKNRRSSAYYHAMYLAQRTIRDLALQLSKLARIDLRGIVRLVHVKRMGLSIIVDDDVIQHLPEGQDMIASFVEIPAVNRDMRCRPRFESALLSYLTMVTYCRDRWGNIYRCRSSWHNWGRWVLLAIIIAVALIAFFFYACLSARKRRRHGQRPIYGTGWIPGTQPPPGQWQQQQYPSQPPPAPPGYQPSTEHGYGQNYGPNQGYFGQQQYGSELQQPPNAYARDGVYSPPVGPPPGHPK
ncbi:CP2 transcription factor [Aspergillus arachidicola]|uniref:CP2 transcription factor n=1 Tax=Aspergillus arachidicola TaxID=656916 RepID=A0A2G7FV56_9EURO|nr:CP2 transcription factor [Aspergillus arachidicola]